ncbi:MAG TPA: hypothetical protein VF519_02590 [Mycobacteriales bacterium]
MSSFPYRSDGGAARPVVDVVAHHGPRSARVSALLDTGSLQTVFDHHVAGELGIALGRKGAEQRMLRLLGGTWTVQFEHVDLALAGTDEFWAARVGFLTAPGPRLPALGLLGSAGFFDRYVVTFAEYHDRVTVEHAADVPPV